MSMLRDWWPSEDILERKRSATGSIKQNVSSIGNTSGIGSKYSAALKLSDIATALQTFPPGIVKSVPPPPTAFRPAAKAASRDFGDGFLKTLRHVPSFSERAHPILPKGPKPINKKLTLGPLNRQKKNTLLLRQQGHPIRKDGLSRREIHIHSERQRRRGMTHLYATLHSLLPEAKPKTDRCTVLNEAMTYIQLLRKKLAELARKKAEIVASMGGVKRHTTKTRQMNLSAADSVLYDTATENKILDMQNYCLPSSAAGDVSVRYSGNDAFIIIYCSKKKGLWSGIMQLLHEHELEVINVSRSTTTDTDFHCIHAKISNASNVRNYDLQKQLQSLTMEEAE